MKRTMRTGVFIGLLLGLCVTANALAQSSNQAALVVSLGDGEVITRCVQFQEEQISGYELLARSGLPLETDVVGLGSTVCRIDATGCAASDCFCECKGGGDCIYWSYWHQRDGVWSYSNVGADAFVVSNGAVDGWVWDVGSPNEAPPPPDFTFAEICVSSMVAAVDTAETPVPGQAVADASPQSSDAGIDVPSPGAAAQVPEDSTATEGVGVPWSLLALAGLLMVGVVVLLAVRR